MLLVDSQKYPEVLILNILSCILVLFICTVFPDVQLLIKKF